MKNKCNAGIRGIFLLFLLVSSRWLLGSDSVSFLKWWSAAFLLGMAVFPLTGKLCSSFLDGGWMVSKVLGIACSGFMVWLLVCYKTVKFSGNTCLFLAVSLAVICWGIWGRTSFFQGKIRAVLDGELIFTFFFLLWTYFAGFRPAAYGTEKFMDYGFMMAMMRSETLPAKDLWYAGENLNYYYGGQYFAVFLTKLTGTQVAQTYHLMRTLVAGLAFALPFTLVRQMILDYREGENVKGTAALGGLLAGAGVSLAGNMHYVVIGKVLPWIREIFDLPKGDYTYWFPNSTRYIGYYPAEQDKTIHEFPSYSFVLGDLHAHVVNVMFVLAVICLIYAMIQYAGRHPLSLYEGKRWYVKILLEPYVWLFAFFIGLFHWTNYWDFVIYYVMGGLGVIYSNWLRLEQEKNLKGRLRLTAMVSVVHALQVFLLGSVFALPFTLQFETMVSGIALAKNHSRPYQWWLIWGLQIAVTLCFMICVIRRWKKEQQMPKIPDFFGIVLGFSALGLIVIPEIVYVRDIYEKEYARSNTMFKLTYQAFIMFGILMAYAFVRLWLDRKCYLRKIVLSAGFLCFAGCCCYIGTAVHSWFGQVWDKEKYQGLDATAFLEKSFSQDASAIRWLNDHVEGNPVVLEANGDSYSDYERVSAMTGLPTILGWYVHEWLWRGGIEDLNQRVGLVEAVYTSSDETLIRSILEEYEVEYIFVGKMEREKYPNLNEVMLQGLGEIAFRDESTGTYIVRVK